MDRGVINYRDRAKQLRNFDGLVFGTITPTDIDGFLDFGNKLFVLLEFKVEGVEMPRGQELALERLVDNLEMNKKHTIAIVGIHNHPVEDDIDCSNCIVEKIRYKYKWIHRSEKPTVRQMIDKFLTAFNYEYKAENPEEFILTDAQMDEIERMELEK